MKCKYRILVIAKTELDRTNPEIAATQFILINNIVELIAKDSPTHGIRRLVKVSQDIHQCTRTKSEKPHVLPERSKV